MGYSIFCVGDDVRIVSGSFAGMVGIVAPPSSAHQSSGTVVLSTERMLSAPSDKRHVTVAAVIDGHSIALRVPPELLERF
jgi:hypothetical protein